METTVAVPDRRTAVIRGLVHSAPAQEVHSAPAQEMLWVLTVYALEGGREASYDEGCCEEVTPAVP